MVQKDIHPCKVSAISTSKTGKHGSAKCNITAIDIFTGKKYESINPSSETAQIPFVIRKEYSLVDISGDGFTTLMDEEGNCREDVTLPEWPDNFAREIENAFGTGKPHSVTVLTAMGHDQIVSIKEDQEGKA
jgi:translation initiation factor 5A